MELLKIKFIRRWEMFIPESFEKCKKEEKRYSILYVPERKNELGTSYAVIDEKSQTWDLVKRKNDIDLKFHFLEPSTYPKDGNPKGGKTERFTQELHEDCTIYP